jgi:hypothetical protein
MTGKELREFAAMVPDDAIIEINMGVTSTPYWKAIEPERIQAIVQPRLLRPSTSGAFTPVEAA